MGAMSEVGTRSLGSPVTNGVYLPPSEVYPAGVELTSQSAPASCVYFIESGGVKLVHGYPEGREIILDLKLPGEFVGASSVLLSERCAAAAITTVRSILVRWSARQFLAELDRNHSFSMLVNKILSREVRELRGRLAVVAHGCARARVLHFLNEHVVSAQASDKPAWIPLRLPMTQRELAQVLAISPFHLSKVLTALERDCLIRRAKGRIDIDPAALASQLNTVRQRSAARATT
jgi:CRP/FNR family cyclic AMP-dependent transcriptional regulator